LSTFPGYLGIRTYLAFYSGGGPDFSYSDSFLFLPLTPRAARETASKA